MLKSLLIALFAGLLASLPAGAQTVGTVFGPGVDADDVGAEYRIALAQDEPGDDVSYAQRLHVQRALNGAVRLRLVANFRDRIRSDWEFDSIQGEVLWQLVERTPSGFSTGFRFDAKLSEGDNKPHQLGVNWTSEWVFAQKWRARGIILLDRDIGSDSRDDVFLDTRASLSRKFDNGLRVSLDSFSDLGSFDAGFGSFDDQEHQLGLSVTGKLTDDWGWTVAALAGVSKSAPERDLAFRVTRAFAPGE